MKENDFDAALVAAAFTLGAEKGWRMVSPAAAAAAARFDLAMARRRFSSRAAILVKFGVLADAHAMAGAAADGAARDRLFDILLRRFDFLQMHRAGLLALLKTLPLEPALAASLARATVTSMGWMLEAAGVSASGITGSLRKRGLAAVWAWGLRTWLTDDTADLSATMAAVDVALNRADQIASRFDHAETATDKSPASDTADIPFTEVPDVP